MERDSKPNRRTTEHGVGLDVVLVLLLIPVVLLLVHFLQPEGAKTESSSGAPTHESR